MDGLEGTVENIERAIGEAATARSIAIDYYQGLGPPDLCFLSKVFHRAWLPSNIADLPATGYYHWVVGADCSCPAAVSAYFDSLLRAVQPPSWYQSGAYTVTKATFCLFNAFRKVDIRCEATFPGKVRVFAVDGKGVSSEGVSDELWEEAFLCSCLRALHPPPDLPHIKIQTNLPLPLDRTFLSLAEKHFWKGVKLGQAPDEPTHAIAFNLLSVTVRDYFRNIRRAESAVDFFLKLAPQQPALASHVADAFLRLEDAARAHAVLDDALKTAPKEPVLLLKRCQVLLAEGKLAQAIGVGEEAVMEDATQIDGWILLAEAYSRLKQVDMALVMLNEAPLKQAKPAPIIGIPKFYAATQVAMGAQPASLIIPRDFDEELEEELLDLPARPRPEPLPAASFTGGQWAEAYRILVEIMNGIGWDELLEVRARVFLMKEDVDRPARRTQSATAQRDRKSVV